jgi:hypothetical protein
VWGLLSELVLTGGGYSIVNAAVMALAAGATLTAWNVLWRRYKQRPATTTEPDRSNPLL